VALPRAWLHNVVMIRVSPIVALLVLATVFLPAPRAVLAQVSAPAVSGDPWSREVAVADRGPDERLAAQSLAMRAVLLANSGDKTLLNRDDVRAGLRDAESYVERFDYRAPPPGTVIAPGTPLTDRVRESGEATQLMRVSFDRARMGALIAGGDDEGRPASADEGVDPFLAVDAALMWLLIEDGRREILVSDPAAANVRARAREIAGARGFALRYPTGDDEDAAMVGAEEIRAVGLDRLRLASERYGEAVVLSGRLARDGLDAWQGSWTKFAGTSVASETFSTGSLDEALQEGIAWLSTSTSGGDDSYRYGGEAASDTEALVWVGALESVGAYATVMNFLSGVPGVGTVYPREIDELGMTFTVVPRGALPTIASAAEGVSWLRRTNPPAARTPAARTPAARNDGQFGSDSGAGRAGGRAPGAIGADGDVAIADGTTDIARRPDGRTPDGRTPDGRTPDGRTPDGRRPPTPLASDAELAFDYLR